MAGRIHMLLEIDVEARFSLPAQAGASLFFWRTLAAGR